MRNLINITALALAGAGVAFGLADPDMVPLVAGIFGFGGSKTQSQSSSFQEGFSTGRSLQESRSVSDAVSSSLGRSRSTQDVFGADVFEQLFGGATNAAARAARSSTLGPSAQALFTGGTRFLDTLEGAGSEVRERLAGGDELLDERIGALGEDVGRFLRREALPSIEARAVGAGGLGGARQGLAEGRAIEGATREFQRGATELRAEDQVRRDSLAGQLGQLETAAAGTGLESLPSLFGVAEGAATAELAPFERLSAILGAPTALTQAESVQTAESVAQSLSESLGISMEDARNLARSQSTSSGRSFSFSPV